MPLKALRNFGRYVEFHLLRGHVFDLVFLQTLLQLRIHLYRQIRRLTFIGGCHE